MCAVDDDDAGEAEVDGAAEENGADCYADEIHDERGFMERIEMELNAPSVSNDFEDQTSN